MPQPVHLGHARPNRMPLVDSKLFDVISATGNERALAGQSVGTIQHLPLLKRPDRQGPGLAALGPGRFQNQVIPLIHIGRYELDRFFPSQAKGLLQLQTHTDVLVSYLRQIRLQNGFGSGSAGDELPIRYSIMVVRARHHILAIHFPGPPTECRRTVLDRSRSNITL